MASKRLVPLSNGIEIWWADALPNGVITAPIGSLCIVQSAGIVSLWQCTVAPNTWITFNVLISGVPLSTVTASLRNTAIDNTLFSETWTWSSATTQTLFSLIANALTSGKILSLSSSSLTQTGPALEILAATTAAIANGVVRVQATGAHTGNLVQIDSATLAGVLLALNASALTSGTVASMVANALTSGTILALTTTSLTLNSTLGLLRVANLGGSKTGILARFQANSTAGSGMTVLANGNVGLGTQSPIAQLHNAGATVFTPVPITDKASGDIGTAPNTVDVATAFDINQTTAGQTLTLPPPTNAASGRWVLVSNVGTQSFTMYNVTITVPGTPETATQAFYWNGSAWTAA